MKKRFFILWLFIIFAFNSCNKNKAIILDNSEPDALKFDIEWVVITEPYVAYRKNPSWESEVEGHCRKADILKVKGKSFSKDGIWYKFDSGWLNESSLDIYNNKFKAKNAASKLK